MSNISAAQVKELRERTGAGMMECKKALEVSSGDMERAIDELRKSGAAKAGKKSGRIAAEGAIVIAENDDHAVMVEINSETDFVSRDGNFVGFVKAVGETALNTKTQDADQLLTQTLAGQGKSVEEARLELVSKVGENVQIRRLVQSNSPAATRGTYLHGQRIGVIVELSADSQADMAKVKELARELAQHIAASRPLVVSQEDVSQELVEREKAIYMAQAATSGKPQEIVEKMVVGRLKKYLDEVSLTGQPFVKDPDVTVGSLLNKNRAKVLAFHRFEVGEGIEKVTEDFKEAVMSQIQNG